MKIDEVRAKYEEKLKQKANVIGVGKGRKITDGKETDVTCVRVYVKEKIDIHKLKSKDIIPRTLEQIPTDVIVMGEVNALGRTDKQRPCHPGKSIGHYRISAGTFGCVVKDKSDKRMILSNNHVMANSNNARVGDAILQPGPHDGGSIADKIATLTKFIPIDFGEGNRASRIISKIVNGVFKLFNSQCRVEPMSLESHNLVDTAIAQPMNDEDILDEILEIGTPTGSMIAIGDMKVQKSGRTTGLTKGKIVDTNATIKVSYGGGKVATFQDQIVVVPEWENPFSAGGDSGSAIVTQEDPLRVVGLLFAGSTSHTIANKIQHVEQLLEVSV